MSLIRRTQIENILGEISANNSSTTPLTSGGIFLGETDDVSGFKAIGVYLHSDTDGIVDFEYSNDGVNWDYVKSVNITGDSSSYQKYFQLAIVAQYFRIRFTNGDVVQTEFRLQTILHPVTTIGEQQRISDSIGDQTFVTIGKNVVAADTLDVGYRDIVATRRGQLKVSTFEVDEGSQYTWTASQTLSAGQVGTFQIIPPSAGSGFEVLVAFDIIGKDDYELRFFEDSVFSFDGFDVRFINPVAPALINRNRNISDVPGFGLYAMSTPTVSGNFLTSTRLEEGGKWSSAVASRPAELLLKEGSRHLIWLKNWSASSQIISWIAEFTYREKITG